MSHATFAPARHRVQSIGKAYAFLNSECEQEKIRHTLVKMKADPDHNVPRDLRVFLYDIRDLHRNSVVVGPQEASLVNVADWWAKRGANLFMRTLLPGASNEETALAVGNAVAVLHGNNMLAGNGRPLGDVYCWNAAGRFVTRDQVEKSQAELQAQYVEPIAVWARTGS